MRPSPIKETALVLGHSIYQPDSLMIDDVRELLTQLSPESIIVVAYGKIIPPWLIGLPPFGIVNVHGSILPKYRGAAPVNWAIARGETCTGVTTMQIDDGLDTGPVYLSEETKIGLDETAPELTTRLACMGAPLLVRTLEGMEGGELLPKSQDHMEVTSAPRLKKEDGEINWNETAREIHNKVRAFLPWPSVTVRFREIPCKILASRLTDDSDATKAQPGSILGTGNSMKVVCGGGSIIELLLVQLESRAPVTGGELLNGMRIRNGEKFSSMGCQKTTM